MSSIKEAIRRAVTEAGTSSISRPDAHGEKELRDLDRELVVANESLKKAVSQYQKMYRLFFEVYYDYKYEPKSVETAADVASALKGVDHWKQEVKVAFERVNELYKKLPTSDKSV